MAEEEDCQQPKQHRSRSDSYLVSEHSAEEMSVEQDDLGRTDRGTKAKRSRSQPVGPDLDDDSQLYGGEEYGDGHEEYVSESEREGRNDSSSESSSAAMPSPNRDEMHDAARHGVSKVDASTRSFNTFQSSETPLDKTSLETGLSDPNMKKRHIKSTRFSLSSSVTPPPLPQDRRKAHIASEQKRRQSINGGFEELRRIIPNCMGRSNSKATLLRKTANYVSQLQTEVARLRTAMGMAPTPATKSAPLGAESTEGMRRMLPGRMSLTSDPVNRPSHAPYPQYCPYPAGPYPSHHHLRQRPTPLPHCPLSCHPTTSAYSGYRSLPAVPTVRSGYSDTYRSMSIDTGMRMPGNSAPASPPTAPRSNNGRLPSISALLEHQGAPARFARSTVARHGPEDYASAASLSMLKSTHG